MSIVFTLRNEKLEIEAQNIQVNKALEELGLSPQAYLVLRNGEILTDRELIRDGEEIKLVSVISGG